MIPHKYSGSRSYIRRGFAEGTESSQRLGFWNYSRGHQHDFPHCNSPFLMMPSRALSDFKQGCTRAISEKQPGPCPASPQCLWASSDVLCLHHPTDVTEVPNAWGRPAAPLCLSMMPTKPVSATAGYFDKELSLCFTNMSSRSLLMLQEHGNYS